MKSLPVDDPLTGDTIVVTSYTTATSRFLRHWIQLAGKKRLPLTKLTRAECIAEGIPLDQFQTQFEEAKAMRAEKAGTITYELRISAGLFGTSIWDEAHRLKNLVTQMLYTLIKMRHRRVLLLTASPFMRRLKDLTSILQVVAETSVTQLLASGSQKRVKVVEDYDDIRVLLAENGGSYLAADKQTQARLITALDPNAYEGIMNAHDDTPSIVRKVVPAPLSILALRRVTGQKVWVDGVEYTIAGNIPPFHCCVVELEPTAWESLYYGRAHRAKFGEEDSYQVEATEHAKGIDPPTPVGPQPVVDAETEGRENVDKRRRLQTASNNSALDNMYEYKMPADAKTVQKWYVLSKLTGQ